MFGPKGDVSRPITDCVKESLFNVLCSTGILPVQTRPGWPCYCFRGKIVADLFCGVGSLGLEALSRGAEFVTFVEQDPKIIAVLEKNVEKAGFAGESPLGDTPLSDGVSDLRWKIIRADAFKIGAPIDFDRQRYDLVFVDPPYSATRPVRKARPSNGARETKAGSPLAGLLNILAEQSAPEAVVVVRTDKHTELLDRYGRFQTIERRRWGTMAVSILVKSA